MERVVAYLPLFLLIYLLQFNGKIPSTMFCTNIHKQNIRVYYSMEIRTFKDISPCIFFL